MANRRLFATWSISLPPTSKAANVVQNFVQFDTGLKGLLGFDISFIPDAGYGSANEGFLTVLLKTGYATNGATGTAMESEPVEKGDETGAGLGVAFRGMPTGGTPKTKRVFGWNTRHPLSVRFNHFVQLSGISILEIPGGTHPAGVFSATCYVLK